MTRSNVARRSGARRSSRNLALHASTPTTVRYSGDAEIRLGWDPRRRVYRGRIVDPYLRFRGGVAMNPRFQRDPRSSEAYDDAAQRFATFVQERARSRGRAFAFDEERGRIQIRRIFQSPCPMD